MSAARPRPLAALLRALLLGLVGLVGLLWLLDAERTSGARATNEPAASAGAASGELARAARVDTRAALGPASPGFLDLRPRLFPAPHAEAFAFSLRIRLVDPWDRPLPMADVYLAPAGAPLHHVGRTSLEGDVRVSWRAKTAASEVRVLVEHPDHGSSLRRFALGRTEVELRLSLRSDDAARDDAERAGQNPVSRLDARLLGRSELDAPYLPRPDPGAGLSPRPERGQEPSPRFEGDWARFTAPPTELDSSRSRTWSALAPRGGSGTVRGQIWQADGTPAPVCLVQIVSAGGLPDRREFSNRDATFGLAGIPAGMATVVVGGGDLPLASAAVEVRAEQVSHVELFLGSEPPLDGRLLDALGQGLEGWQIELEDASDAGLFHDTTWSRAGGAFRFPHPGAGAHRLLARAPGSWERLPVFQAPLAATRVLEVRLPEECTRSARMRARAPQAAADLRAELWQTESGRGLWLEPDAEGALVADGVPPGLYTLRYGTASRGWIETPAFALAADAELDLGELGLPAAAALELVSNASSGVTSAELFRLERELNLWVAHVDLTVPWRAELPSGAYALGAPGREPREFSLQPGEPCRLELE